MVRAHMMMFGSTSDHTLLLAVTTATATATAATATATTQKWFP
jgi:hypothetical protein